MATIHKEIAFPASPSWVYGALLDPKQFAKLSRAKATGEPVVGGPFSHFDGHVTGRLVELVPAKRIVLAWRVKTWPGGIYSIVRFELEHAERTTIYGEGTNLLFEQHGFPPADQDELLQIWKTYCEALFSAFS